MEFLLICLFFFSPSSSQQFRQLRHIVRNTAITCALPSIVPAHMLQLSACEVMHLSRSRRRPATHQNPGTPASSNAHDPTHLLAASRLDQLNLLHLSQGIKAWSIVRAPHNSHQPMVSTLPVPESCTSTPEILANSSFVRLHISTEPFQPLLFSSEQHNRIVRLASRQTFCSARAAPARHRSRPIVRSPGAQSPTSLDAAPMITTSSGFSAPRSPPPCCTPAPASAEASRNAYLRLPRAPPSCKCPNIS